MKPSAFLLYKDLDDEIACVKETIILKLNILRNNGLSKQNYFVCRKRNLWEKKAKTDLFPHSPFKATWFIHQQLWKQTTVKDSVKTVTLAIANWVMVIPMVAQSIIRVKDILTCYLMMRHCKKICKKFCQETVDIVSSYCVHKRWRCTISKIVCKFSKIVLLV